MSTILRLLQQIDETSYRLESFRRSDAPPYTVLSHTWSEDPSDEVSLLDINAGTAHKKKAFLKLEFCAKQTHRDDFEYFWIDTCCIDKTNEVEEKSTVSLMWQIYEAAAKCYTLLSDVIALPAPDEIQPFPFGWGKAMENSRWFTRGWTLQELLAPRIVEFYSLDGFKLGDKRTLKERICRITGISPAALEGQELDSFTVEERLSWAETRKTTRGEDWSYSLFGVFGVSMEIKYGEGRVKARERLEREIGNRPAASSVHDEGTPILREPHTEHPVLDWLSIVDFVTQQRDVLARRQAGTAHLMFESRRFVGWIHGHHKTILFTGIPGVGKTMAAAIAAEHVIQRKRFGVGVAGVFCNHRSQTSQGVSSLLATLLRQLVQDRSDLLPIVNHLYDENKATSSRPSRNSLSTALLQVCLDHPCTYIIVDALDECSDQYGARSQLIEQLQWLQTRADVRLLFTSRPIPEVTTSVKADATLRVRNSGDDIARYVRSQFQRMGLVVQQNIDLQRDIVQDIVVAAEGVFLLARLHCDAVADEASEAQVRSMLSNLSSGLDNAYNNMLQRIDGQLQAHQLLAKRAISWVTHCRRPLRAIELCHALAVSKNLRRLDKESVPKIEDVLSVCGGLVVTYDDIDQVVRVRLVHRTAREYLERTRSQWLPDAQVYLAETCLAYLSLDDFQSPGGRKTGRYWPRFRDYPLYPYCTEFWKDDVQMMQEKMVEQITSFLLNPKLYLRWGSMPEGRPGEYILCDLFEGDTPLSAAVSAKLDQVVRRLLSMIPDPNAGGVALQRGASFTSEAVIKVFIEHEDLNVNFQDILGETALMSAASWSREGVVKILLERHDLNINLKDCKGQTALMSAASKGREGIVKILLEHHDLNMNLQDNEGQTALMHAAKRGRLEIVKTLIQCETIEINSKDNYGWTALSWAADKGFGTVAEVLEACNVLDTRKKLSSRLKGLRRIRKDR